MTLVAVPAFVIGRRSFAARIPVTAAVFSSVILRGTAVTLAAMTVGRRVEKFVHDFS